MPLPRSVFAALAVAACAGGEASHIPNPLLLPGQALSTGLENAAYNNRRDRVKGYVTANLPALEGEITTGGGPALSTAMDLAAVPPAARPVLSTLLQNDITLYQGNAEALTVALMVHGG